MKDKMKKPEKKNMKNLTSHEIHEENGYNLAIDEYEKFLPSEEEILEFLPMIVTVEEPTKAVAMPQMIAISKTIAKRIGK